MKNIINIFLFYFVAFILNLWAKEDISFEVFKVLAVEVTGVEEREKEENIAIYNIEIEKLVRKGVGGNGDNNDDHSFAEPRAKLFFSHSPAPLLPLYSDLITFKQYQKNITNSVYAYRLYVVFHCLKAFLP